MIVIIDYGIGNVASIKNMFARLNRESIPRISCDREVIEAANRLILPGVGAFDYGMASLKSLGFVDLIRKKALEDSTPLLGICLGAQLLTQGSEEGELEGIGLLPARTVQFRKNTELRKKNRMHMGWDDVHVKSPFAPLFEGLKEDIRFYFVHAYHFEVDNQDIVLAECSNGYAFPCAIGQNNIFGVQFHPEKSHRFGMQLLKNFSKI